MVKVVGHTIRVSRRVVEEGRAFGDLLRRVMANWEKYLRFPPSQSGPPRDLTLALVEGERGAFRWDEPIYLEQEEEWSGLDALAEKF